MLNSLIRKVGRRLKYPGLSLHPSARIEGGGRLEYGGNCSIGDGCLLVLAGTIRLGSDVTILQGCEFDGRDIVIGDQASLQRNSSILGMVEIGSYCVLGPNLYVASGGHEFRLKPALNIRDQDELKRRQGNPGAKVVIGEDCWFGINVVVREGVRIGKGCVIGANSVVTKDVPPYSVAVGSPAKVIARRLAFEPPRELVPCDDHVPYFYQGFKTRAAERTGKGIRLSGPAFAVCLDLRGAAGVGMELSGVDSMRSGSRTFPAAGGIIEIPVGALQREGEAIRFAVEGGWQAVEVKRIWTE